jgi:hypothetical protein
MAGKRSQVAAKTRHRSADKGCHLQQKKPSRIRAMLPAKGRALRSSRYLVPRRPAKQRRQQQALHTIALIVTIFVDLAGLSWDAASQAT